MVDGAALASRIFKVAVKAGCCGSLLSLLSVAWASPAPCGLLPTTLSGAQAAAISAKFSLTSQLCAEQAPLQDSNAPVGAARDADGPRLPAKTAAAIDASSYADNRPTLPPPAAVGPAKKGRRHIGRSALARALSLDHHVTEVAAAYRIDPLLLHAIAHVESRHNASAISHAGAMGLMQVMPATAQRFGVTSPRTQLLDPRTSLEVSSAYLKKLQDRFDNDLVLIIAAYNAGEGAVEKYGRRVPPYRETQGYVRNVLAHYKLLMGAQQATRVR